MGINYEDVVNIGMYGYTEPANATGIGPAHESWLSQEALDLVAEMGLGNYNPDAAGYVDTDGDGVRDLPDGSPLEFKLQVVEGWNDWITSVQVIGQSYQELGLNAGVESVDFGTLFENLQNGTYDTSMGWSTGGRTPWNFYRNTLESSLIAEDGTAGGQLWGRWTSDETDQHLKDFVATADLAEQKAIINKLQKAYIENIVAIPLFYQPTWYEYNTLRFTGFPTPDNYYAQGSPWDNNEARLLIVATRIHCKDNTSCGQ